MKYRKKIKEKIKEILEQKNTFTKIHNELLELSSNKFFFLKQIKFG